MKPTTNLQMQERPNFSDTLARARDVRRSLWRSVATEEQTPIHEGKIVWYIDSAAEKHLNLSLGLFGSKNGEERKEEASCHHSMKERCLSGI
jgi:hypothetical protein